MPDHVRGDVPEVEGGPEYDLDRVRKDEAYERAKRWHRERYGNDE